MSTLRLGMLTPSSNTVLEPMTTQILAGLPGVSVHFSRFRVTTIGLDAEALGQFDDKPMLASAELLADAKVDAISWNGTSAGWLGLDSDRNLCRRITAATGIPASTSVLALFDIFRRRGERRIGLVTPYTRDVQHAIVTGFAGEGVEVVAERHLGMRDNFSFGTVQQSSLRRMIDDVAQSRPDAITIFCTNLRGAESVAEMEMRHNLPIHDSVATAVYGALAAAGGDTSAIAGFGRMFGAP